MAARESEYPAKGRLPGGAGGRPLPVGAAGSDGRANGSAPSNRPIPLGPKDALPQPFEDDGDEKDDMQEILRNAPAWLVSTVFHTLLLIVLGLLAVTVQLKPEKLEIEVTSPEQYAEQLGTQLENPSILEGDSTHVDKDAKEQLITPKDMTAVDDPFAAPPNLGDLNLSVGNSASALASSNISGAPIGLALSGRQIGSRNVLLGKYGGTKTTEESVERALDWLVKQQQADGLWSLKGPYPDGAFTENREAATAMALLAFQGHGDTHRSGKYTKIVQKAWSALLKQQSREGTFGTQAVEKSQLLYTHAQCTIALCELYGMTNDSQYRIPAERAIAYAVSVQDPKKGGWRYIPGQDSDTSVTGWFVMALQSARMARMKVPKETLDNIVRYLDFAQVDDGRGYGYWEGGRTNPAMCAEGLLCREYLGWRQDDPRLIDGVSALLKHPVQYGGTESQDVYYWYYATQATHHMEGKIWDEWNKVMRQRVPENQIKTGTQSGSWDPSGDQWGSHGGRLFVTCLSTYMLEVYYRHLPLYSGYRFVPEAEPETEKPAEAAEKSPAGDAAKAAPAESGQAKP